jgi:hypothetical protein
MTAPTRIYLVSNTAADVNADTGKPHARLVRAPNAAQALRHVAADTLLVEVASQDKLVELVAAGVKVETSGRAGELAQMALL